MKAKKLTPLINRVIIRQTEEVRNTTKGGILLPDATPETIGTVVAVGKGKWSNGVRVPVDFKAGDTVLFGVFSGQRIKWEDEELIFMKDDDVLAVLK